MKPQTENKPVRISGTRWASCKELLKLADKENIDIDIDSEHPIFRDFDGKLMMCGGAICTHAQYENFVPSVAHLFEDGRILAYGREIGDWTQIKLRGQGIGVGTDAANVDTPSPNE